MALMERSARYWLLLVAALVGWGPGVLCAASPQEIQATVVVYNQNDPTSLALANYYAQKRGIPSGNLVGLACPQLEEISREEYRGTIADPLRQAFVQRGWWTTDGGQVTQSQIRFVVLMRGMPLKIRSMNPPPAELTLNRDEASVDSELACMGFYSGTPVGPIKNPYADRVTPITEALVEPGLLLVCRLDATTDITVRAMIDDAIAAEQTGLWGWAYIDSRGLQDGPLKEGDDWLGNIAQGLRQSGIPVLWDKAPDTMPGGYPVTDAALYYGWYDGNVSGPFADPSMKFQPGAVAVHIHSFSAWTLRSATANWCGPLLERGVAATLGNVYEPYLTLTSHLDVFQQRLLEGYTFAESAYASLMALSWMNVAIGDPLYRPFAATKTAQVDGNIWALYRQIVLAEGGSITAASSDLESAARRTGNSMFLESLAAAQADAGTYNAALGTINEALQMKNKPLVAFRLSLAKLGVLGVMGRYPDARALLMAQLTKPPGPLQSGLLQRIKDKYFPDPKPSPTP